MISYCRLLFFLLLLSPISILAEFEIPSITNHINDQAGLLSERSEIELNQILAKVKKDTSIELAVLTVDSLSGLPIETASIKIVEKWKLGTAKEDKGVLLLISLNDKKLRIEVGQGLEGTLTDLKSRRIIDQIIVPLIRQNDFDSAIFAGVFEILKSADPEVDFRAYFSDQRYQPRELSTKRKGKSGLSLIIFMVIFIIIVSFISPGGGSGFTRGPYRSGGFGGGFGGGGFGGGGSFGGGGGFSGGGASGGW